MTSTHRILRTATLTLAAVLFAVPASFVAPASAAAPRTVSQQRESLRFLLGAYELRLNRNVLDSIGRDVGGLLVEQSSLPRVSTRTRVRAVAGLGYYPTSRTRSYLTGLIHGHTPKGAGVDVQIRRQALRSLAVAFKDAAVDEVLSVRADPNPLVREAAAHALGDAGSGRAATALKTWLSREPELSVRVAIDRALTRLRSAP